MAEFNRILTSVDRLAIAISSAWRYMILRGDVTPRGFGHMLRTHGVHKDVWVLEATCSDEDEPARGRQILRWLQKENRERLTIESFCVLDDCPPGVCFKPVEKRLVRTDGTRGLTAADADRVIEMLSRGWK